MFSQFFKKALRGFTLIEILIVIGIIAILAAIVIVAINPAKQFAQARNTQREAGINSILNAVGQRMADNKGVFAGSFNGGNEVCPTLTTSGSSTVTAVDETISTNVNGNLGCLVPTYISAIPPAPLSGETYTISASTTGRISVCAPGAATENAIPDAALICVTR